MNMEALSISWLVTSATAPLVAVLALWTIYVFHTYRRRWRTVDLFLLAVIAQELAASISVFSLSITNLLLGEACAFSQWTSIASRTLQISTLASLSIDRALTVRWPYRYRFSVRRNQIRWHVAALALAAGLVAGAALFARTGGVQQLPCRLHPQQWDVRYGVFLEALQGSLVLVALACLARVEVHRWGAGGTLEEGGSPDLPAGGMSSPLDTQSSTGSTRALHRPSRQASRRPYGRKGSAADLRWPSVALTVLLCFFCNHIPYLVLTGLATWHPWLWTRWHEAILCWLGLLEGLLVPLLLFCKDPALRTALRRAFQRRSGALSPLVGDDGPFQMYFDKDHFRKRGTFGSVTPIGIITNYRRTPGGSGGKKGGRGGPKYALHGHDSVLAKSCFLGGGEPLSKLSCADLTSLEMWREEDEENFYATLSDDFSTFSCKSADDSALSEDLRLSEELYGGSFTTVANDDFEFHDTRPCGGEVRMKPCLVSPATPPGSRKTSFRDNIRLKVNLPMSPPNQSVPAIPKEEDEYKDPDLFILPPEEWKNDSDDHTDLSSSPPSSELPTPPERTTSMSRHPKSTSYSMNDLDLIHKGGGPSPGQEATFALPVKSESTMSLYRLNVDQEVDQVLAMTPSRSENNVNGDSGFGSGAQSTNPVWSGFLCRKPSDPFWNMRKPTTAHAPSSSSTPTKNYPGILHPRMRKIPWITAWKKLDENSIHNERNHQKELPSPPQVVEMGCQTNALGWKDNLVYDGVVVSPDAITTRVGTIDEELSDVGSPVCNIVTNSGDYNLNIFAKESGVLIENAYGKLVRDDLGVQVNFYKKNVQCEEDNNNHRDLSNLFERAVEPVRPACLPIREQVYFHQEEDKIENRYPNEVVVDKEVEEPFKVEQRLNGGHYENLFGTKENIFAGCDLYKDRDNNRGSFRNEDSSAKNIYGQLNKVGKGGRSPQKSKLTRRESDNRGNRTPKNRRGENRTRSDTRDMFPKEVATTFAELRAAAAPEKNLPVEIEMKNVVSKEPTTKIDRKDSERKIPERKLSGRIPVHVHTREAAAAKPLDVSFRCSNQPVERKSSERRAIPRPIERKNSSQKKTVKSEGLWANALPFDQDEANGNSPQRKGAAKTPFKRSPRRSHLPRRESSNRNERPVSNAKRKAEVSADDFLKYREKCEDNFSHIQNLNRVDPGVKLNGNEYPQGGAVPAFLQNSRPPFDENDNNRKLTIADFL